MCALVPAMPKALTPPMRGPAISGQDWTCRAGFRTAHRPKESPGLSSVQCRLGGIAPWCSASATLISPATPAAPSVWPMLVLTEPTQARRPARAALAKHGAERAELDRIAGARAGAVRLDVPDTRRGQTPASR